MFNRISSPLGGPFSFFALLAGAILLGLTVFSVHTGIARIEDAGLFALGIGFALERVERQFARTIYAGIEFLLLCGAVLSLGLALFGPAAHTTERVDAALLLWGVAWLFDWTIAELDKRHYLASLLPHSHPAPTAPAATDTESPPLPAASAQLDEILVFLYGAALLAAVVFLAAATFSISVGGIHPVYAGFFAWSLAWVIDLYSRTARMIEGVLISFAATIAAAFFMGAAVFSVSLGSIHLVEAGLFLWAVARVARRLERGQLP